MTDLDATLREICEHPEQEWDWARLRYADLLLDDGQAERAEFVRVQVKLARMPLTERDPRCGVGGEELKRRLREVGKDENAAVPCANCWPEAKELRRRETELLRTMQPGSSIGQEGIKNVRAEAFFVWAGAVAKLHCPDRKGWSFSRGFIYSITGDWESISKVLDLMVWQPPRKCDATGCKDGWVSVEPKRGPKGPGVEKRWVQEPPKRIKCPECRGSGSVPGATMPCPDCKGRRVKLKGKMSLATGKTRWREEGCSQCSGSGRIAVPFSRTMQPIEVVTLTTLPTIRAYDGGGWGLTEEDLRKDLHERWPSIKTWNLPTLPNGSRVDANIP